MIGYSVFQYHGLLLWMFSHLSNSSLSSSSRHSAHSYIIHSTCTTQPRRSPEGWWGGPCPCHRCPGRGPGNARECGEEPWVGRARVWRPRYLLGACQDYTTATQLHCSISSSAQTQPPSPAPCSARRSRPCQPSPSLRWTTTPSSSWGSPWVNLLNSQESGGTRHSILHVRAWTG